MFYIYKLLIKMIQKFPLTLSNFLYIRRNYRKAFYGHRFCSQTTETPKPTPKPFKDIPGPSSLPIIGSLHHFLPLIGQIGNMKNFLELSASLHQNYGTIVRMEIFARGNMVILYEPAHFEQVYRAEDVIPLRPGFETLEYYRTTLRKERFDGIYGLTTAQGMKWRDFRTKVNPALLKPQLVKLYEPGLDEIAKDAVERLTKIKDEEYLQRNFDFELTKWSLESVGLVGLGARLGCLRDDLDESHPSRLLIKCAHDVFELAFKLEFFPNPWKYMSTPSFKKIIKTFDLQWELSEMYINQAKQRIKDRIHMVAEEDKSIIEKLLAVDGTVAVMMANEMLLAGIDTVAFATTALLYCLATNPKAQENLRNEIRSKELSKRYLRACIKESMRLLPVLSANLRRTSKEHIVGGYLIHEGVDVIAPHEYLSKMEKNYLQANKFLPERWIVDKTDPLHYGKCHPMTTLPFGYGIRTCIGRRIAELEIETFITRLLDEVKISWHGPPIQVVTKVMNTFIKPYHFKFESAK